MANMLPLKCIRDNTLGVNCCVTWESLDKSPDYPFGAWNRLLRKNSLLIGCTHTTQGLK